MHIIYNTTTRKIICWSEEGQKGVVYPSPGPGEVETRLDCTVEEFENSCRESSGNWDSEGVGENFLHPTVQDATDSTKTNKKGVKVGHMAVEVKDQREDRPLSIADKIEKNRKDKGKKLNDPITLDELREAESQ